MVGDIQDIRCNKCGRYLFTEKDLKNGYTRKNDHENYYYDDKQDIFICDECEISKEDLWEN